MDDGASRIPAARWVISLGRSYGGLLVLAAAWSLLAAAFAGSPVALVLPVVLAGYAAAWGLLLRAFTAHRRGAWQLLVGVTATGVLWPWAGRPLSPLDVVALAVHGGLLILLLHRDSRDWVGADDRRRLAGRRSGRWGAARVPRCQEARDGR